MKWKVIRPLAFLRIAKTSFHLKKYLLSPATIQLLTDIYPGVNWQRVDFYEGLPWFTPAVAPYVTAQALPQFYSFGRFRIYLSKFDESRAQCLADVVHEAFHVMQAMHFMKGYGIGFFRGFMFFYIAHFAKYGYRNNPFEIPAYNQEYRFLDYCERHQIAGILPAVKPGAFKDIQKEDALVFPRYHFSYKENFIYLAGSFLFCTMVTVVKPVVDATLFVLLLFIPEQKIQKMSQKTEVIRK